MIHSLSVSHNRVNGTLTQTEWFSRQLCPAIEQYQSFERVHYNVSKPK
jgi:uncharacterized membrane-anchored protein